MDTKTQTVEVIDPRWLLKAMGLVVLAALLCGYLTVCALFYKGQWQLVLHPVAKVAQTPAMDALPFTVQRFGDTGQRMLWEVPSDSSSDRTVLLLHGGDGNLGDTVPLIQLLHAAHLHVFALEYGGFGSSVGEKGGKHPTEARMQADAEAAVDYVTHQRHLPSGGLLVLGQGLGASLAVRLAKTRGEVWGLILDQPDGDLKQRIKHDAHTRGIPVSLLFHQDFPLIEPLQTLHMPKLILSRIGQPIPFDSHRIADPKMMITLKAGDSTAYLEGLRRFLDDVAAPSSTGFRPMVE